MYFSNYDINKDTRWLAGMSLEIQELSYKIDQIIDRGNPDDHLDSIDDLILIKKDAITTNPFSKIQRNLTNNEHTVLLRFYKSHLYYRLKGLNREHEYYSFLSEIFLKLDNQIGVVHDVSSTEHAQLSLACYNSFRDVNISVNWWDYCFYYFGAKPYIPYYEFDKFKILVETSNEEKYKTRLFNIIPLLQTNKNAILSQYFFYKSDIEIVGNPEFYPELLSTIIDLDSFRIKMADKEDATQKLISSEVKSNADSSYLNLNIDNKKLRILHKNLESNGYIRATYAEFRKLFKSPEQYKPIVWYESASELGKLFTLINNLKNSDNKKANLISVYPSFLSYKSLVQKLFVKPDGSQFDLKKLSHPAGEKFNYQQSYSVLKKIVDNLKA